MRRKIAGLLVLIVVISLLIAIGRKAPVAAAAPAMSSPIEQKSDRSESESEKQFPGVPANTIERATKVAQDLAEASSAYESGIVVPRDHDTAVWLKARSDAIYETIGEIQSQPVTGKPSDAEKKLPVLRALRSLAKLDDNS